MKTTNFLLGLVLLASISTFSSCQKEVDFQDDINNPPTPPNPPTGTTGDIKGNYTMINERVKTNVTISITQAGETIKAITTSDYTTINNTGTMQVTDNQFITNNISGSVDDVAHSTTYLNGTIVDDSDFPFAFDIPSSSGTSNYVRNSADSITVSGGLVNFNDPSGAPVPTSTEPLGARISLVGDTLTISFKVIVNQTIVEQGVPASYRAIAEGTVKYKKN